MDDQLAAIFSLKERVSPCSRGDVELRALSEDPALDEVDAVSASSSERAGRSVDVGSDGGRDVGSNRDRSARAGTLELDVKVLWVGVDDLKHGKQEVSSDPCNLQLDVGAHLPFNLL